MNFIFSGRRGGPARPTLAGMEGRRAAAYSSGVVRRGIIAVMDSSAALCQKIVCGLRLR